MSLKLNLKFLFLLLYSTSCLSQTPKKTINAIFTEEKITIDANFNETIWNNAPIATDFIMYQPDNGKPISDNKKTTVQVLYNNDAIFLKVIMLDDEPQKIAREITQRDNFGNSDVFGVFINGNNDGQSDFQFLVTSAAVQLDMTSADTAPDDTSWDAVWQSSTKITDTGWQVEMKIPYAAIRFPKNDKQTWGINFYRVIKRTNQEYTWNFIDTNQALFHNQFGTLEGIKNIETPTRLFFIPYSSYYYENNLFGSTNKLKAGLDIKYGINDAFTLDAILIPDFGQTKFDNAILNLTPFEQILDENRPFFTESTDLFNTGNLFYSRRIGQQSRNKSLVNSQLNNDEEIEIFPSSVDLLNALKVSGRTKGGLGIGVLNAITRKTFATVKNNTTNENRKVEIEPLSNYNVFVLDQRFGKNSSVSLVNTNVTRNGSFRDANVTAAVLNYNFKNRKYNLLADYKYSQINAVKDYNGYKSSIFFSKIKGKFRFEESGRYYSKDYDPNDLAFNFFTNYYGFKNKLTYLITNPTKTFNLFTTDFINTFNFNISTGKLQDGLVNYSFASTLKNFNILNLEINYSPYRTYEFYQLRNYDRYALIPQYIGGSIEYITNRNHPFSIGAKPYLKGFNQQDRLTYGLSLSPSYRFNDRLSVSFLSEYEKQNNDIGLVDIDNTNFYYSRRNNQTINNELSAKYSINNKMSFNLIGRYYWAYSENKELFTLLNNGNYNSISTDLTTVSDYNENYNNWNMDLSYSWWFAPASQISVLYRSKASDDRLVAIDKKLGNNLHNLFRQNLDDIFSISIRYYID